MRTIVIKLRISEEQKKAISLRYPRIKFFLEKMISDTADRIIIEEEQFNTGRELKEYHDRRVLNDYDIHKRKCTQETKDKISKALKGKHIGWHQLPETKKLIGLAHKGKIVSKETREKISLANKGKKRTEEQRKNISLGHKGVKHKRRKIQKINRGAEKRN